MRCKLYWAYDDEYSTFVTRLYAWRIECEEETPEDRELANRIREFTMRILGKRFEEDQLDVALRAIREAFPDCEIKAEYNDWIISCPL